MRLTILFAFLLAGCPVTDDSGKTTDTSTGDTDSGSSDACNTDNEDCTDGTCRGEGGEMLPGSDCLVCHKSGGGEAPPWSVGGTIFADIDGTAGAKNVTIRVTDSTGKTVELNSNNVGNFYGNDKLTPPLTAEVEVGGNVTSMASSVSTGACSSCHTCDGSAGGKLYAP